MAYAPRANPSYTIHTDLYHTVSIESRGYFPLLVQIFLVIFSSRLIEAA